MTKMALQFLVNLQNLQVTDAALSVLAKIPLQMKQSEDNGYFFDVDKFNRLANGE